MPEKAENVLQGGLARYLGPEQLARLAGTRVALAGAGGLGSNCALLLARGGVRKFRLVDFDRVEASNLNRQNFFPADLGRLKVEALAEQMLKLDPGLDIEIRPVRLNRANMREVFDRCPIVVEALDNAADKAALCNLLSREDIFIVAASGLGGLGGPPMRAKRLGEKLVCVGDFSSEAGPASPPLAPRVMQAAAMQAEEVMKRLLGRSPFTAGRTDE